MKNTNEEREGGTEGEKEGGREGQRERKREGGKERGSEEGERKRGEGGEREVKLDTPDTYFITNSWLNSTPSLLLSLFIFSNTSDINDTSVSLNPLNCSEVFSLTSNKRLASGDRVRNPLESIKSTCTHKKFQHAKFFLSIMQKNYDIKLFIQCSCLI